MRLQSPVVSFDVIVEDSRSRNNHIGAGIDHEIDRLIMDPAVHLDADRQPFLIQNRPKMPDLVQDARNQLLSAESGIDRHQKDHIRLVVHIVQHAQRRRGIQRDTGLQSPAADLLQDAVQMHAGLRVHRYAVSTRICKIIHIPSGILYHQMDIAEHVRQGANRLQHRNPEGNARYKHAVHHIKVKDLRTASLHRKDVFSQVCKICGQNRRSQFIYHPGTSFSQNSI